MSFVVGFDTSGLEAGFKSHAQRGIGRYVFELKSYFDRVRGQTSIEVHYFSQASVSRAGNRMLRFMDSLAHKLPVGRHTFKQQVLYPFQLASGGPAKGGAGFDALHFPAHMDAPAWGLKSYALTVLDLIPLVCADLYRAHKSGARFKFARWLEKQAIRQASLVLAISENTARDVNRLMNVSWERLVVTPLGVDERFYLAGNVVEPEVVRRRYNLPPGRDIILYVGGIDPRKNYRMLIKTLEQVAQARQLRGRAAPVLLMVGNIGADREYPRLKALIAEHSVEDLVIMPGFVEERELLKLYAISTLFFFPSLYEGFGLPPLEAMAAGLPVVSSNTSAMPEVLGDAALMVDPTDVSANVQAVLSLLDNAALRKNLAEKGRRQARFFSWEKTGAATLQAYERLMPR